MLKNPNQNIILQIDLTFFFTDPCETRHHSVIDDYRREVNFFTPPGEPYLCDVYMETGWYRFLVNGTDATIPTSCVQVNSCKSNIYTNHPKKQKGTSSNETICQFWVGVCVLNATTVYSMFCNYLKIYLTFWSMSCNYL